MRRREQMTGIPQFGASVLADVIRRQPLSAGKVRLAWQIAAGPQLARALEAEFRPPGTVIVRAKDPRWAAEIERSRALLLQRLTELLDVTDLRLEIVER